MAPYDSKRLSVAKDRGFWSRNMISVAPVSSE